MKEVRGVSLCSFADGDIYKASQGFVIERCFCERL